jgi:hypothetical protein
VAEINYFLPPPDGGRMATAFFTADFALVIARRIELLCDDAAEREPDIEFLIVIPFYSSAAMPLPPPS